MTLQQKPIHSYGNEFNTKSAEQIIPFIIEKLNPVTVVDIGCGIGTWLNVFKRMGIETVCGIDGEHVLISNKLMIPASDFFARDLTKLKFEDINQTFDLAICLEVAEHLSESNAKNLVNLLCKFSNCILFSAAMPGQTGENHLNEQYPDYWQDMFRENEYIFLDPFREMFWNNDDIEWWYRQNLFLVVSKSMEQQLKLPRWNGNIYLIKDMFEMYVHHLASVNKESLPIIGNSGKSSPLSFMTQLSKKILKKISGG